MNDNSNHEEMCTVTFLSDQAYVFHLVGKKKKSHKTYENEYKSYMQKKKFLLKTQFSSFYLEVEVLLYIINLDY